MPEKFQVPEFQVPGRGFRPAASEIKFTKTDRALVFGTLEPGTLELIMMRKTLAVAVLLGVTALSVGQQPEPPAPRYGVPANVETFPQRSPQEALASALKAIDRGKHDYLTAHLLEPKFLDDRVAERARLLEAQAETDLLARRAEQRRSPVPVTRQEKVPDEPKAFLEAVRYEAGQRAFRLVARDVGDTLTEHLDHAKDLRRLLRDGRFQVTGDTATVTHPDIKDRQVTLKRVGTRWFVEDAKEPTAAPGGKK
jgi:hypothetical protein